MPLRARTVIIVALLLVPALRPAHAQARYSAGLAGIVGQPLGDFGRNVSNGFGLDGMGTAGLDSRGIISVRAQLGWMLDPKRAVNLDQQAGHPLQRISLRTKQDAT